MRKVIKVKVLEDYKLELTFDNNVVKQLRFDTEILYLKSYTF